MATKNEEPAVPGPSPGLIDAIRANRGLLVVGSGLSRPAGAPSWAELFQGIALEAERQQPARRRDIAEALQLVKDGRVLDAGDVLETVLGFDELRDVALRAIRAPRTHEPSNKAVKLARTGRKVASLFTALALPGKAPDLQPTASHYMLGRASFRGIVTTNYDRLFEPALDPVLDYAVHSRSSPDFADFLRTGRRFLLKLHGDENNRRDLVLTRSDYARVVNAPGPRQEVLPLFQANTALWVGYGHADPDLDLMVDQNFFRGGLGGGYSIVKTGDTAMLTRLRNAAFTVIELGSYDHLALFLKELMKSLGKLVTFPVTSEFEGDPSAATRLEEQLELTLRGWGTTFAVRGVRRGSVLIVDGSPEELDEVRRRVSSGDREVILKLSQLNVRLFDGIPVAWIPSPTVPTAPPPGPAPAPPPHVSPQGSTIAAAPPPITPAPLIAPARPAASALALRHAVDPSRPLTWLHLSDFHFRGKDRWETDTYLRGLLDDVKVCVEKEGYAPDLVFVTGDIAFSAKKTEYEDAREFLDQLVAVTKVPADSVFTVPGNHDVDRDEVEDAPRSIVADLRAGTRLRDDERGAAIAKFFESKNALGRKALFAPFAAYAAFAQPRCSITDDRLWWAERIEVAGFPLKIAVMGLNTAWTAHGDETKGSLLVGRHQVERALGKLGAIGDDVVIALGHHPFSWATEWDEREVGDLVLHKAQFYLRGHLHEPKEVVVPGGGVEISAGSAYAGSRYSNSYNFVRLDLEAPEAVLRVRRWFPERGGRWAWDPTIGDGKRPGEQVLPLPERLRVKPTVLAAPEAAVPPERRSSTPPNGAVPEVPDREAVLEALKRILAASFEGVVFQLRVPAGKLSPSSTPQSLRAIDLIGYCEAQGASGLKALAIAIEREQKGVLAAVLAERQEP